MPRQQRQPFNRRPWTPPSPPRTGILTAKINQIATHRVDLWFYSIASPPDGSDPRAAVINPFIPMVRRDLDGAFPQASLLVDNGRELRLTYAGTAIDENDRFSIGQNDQGIRTPQGGFCAPGYLSTAPALLTDESFTATLIDPLNVLITLALGQPNTYLNPWQFRNTTTNQYPGAWSSIAAGQITLTFTGTQTVGDTIQYQGYHLISQTPGGTQPSAAPINIT